MGETGRSVAVTSQSLHRFGKFVCAGVGVSKVACLFGQGVLGLVRRGNWSGCVLRATAVCLCCVEVNSEPSVSGIES